MKLSSGLLLLPLAGSYVIPNPSKSKRLDLKPQNVRIGEAAPGVGIQLTTSYATAAIRFHNGTVRNLVKIPAQSDYINLIEQWAISKSQNTCAHSQTRDLHAAPTFKCKVLNRVRELRKRLGLPATVEVGIIASLFQEIKVAVEERLGMKIEHVQPTFPFLEALDEDDITDALQHAGLEWSTGKGRLHTYSYTNAAYAGLGYGVCASWQSNEQCRHEQDRMVPQRTLFFTFDNSTFEAVAQPTVDSITSWVESRVMDQSLGWWSLPVDEIPRAKFWGKMHETILNIGYECARDPARIVLLGDHAHDKEFQATIKTALGELLGSDVQNLLDANRNTNGTMLAARGAAEMAFRARQGHGKEEMQSVLDGGEVLEL